MVKNTSQLMNKLRYMPLKNLINQSYVHQFNTLNHQSKI